MIQKTVTPNNLILLCQKSKTLTLTQLNQIHAHILTSSASHAVAPLISAASKHPPWLPYALSIFHHHQPHNTFVYNTIIRAHTCNHAPLSAIKYYIHLLFNGVNVNHFTFPPLIKASVALAGWDSGLTGRVVHNDVVKFGFGDDPFVVSGLIEFYGGVDIGDARLVFDESSEKDVVVWTAMVDVYGKIGDVENARKVFDEMPERNAISWSAMMAAYSRASDFREVIFLFRRMQEAGTRPNEAVLVRVLTAAGNLGALAQGLWVHAYVKRRRIERNVILATALVDMYAKCGCAEAALEVFEAMAERDARAWNAVINGVAMNGYARRSIQLFDRMVGEKIQPTETTFVAVLSACRHGKMVDKGIELFEKMSTIYGVEPALQHYACVVDLLARAGMVEEAEKFIEEKMGGLGKGDTNVWGALLNACRVHGNVEVGDRIWKKLTDIGVADCGIHVLSYIMYREAGLEFEAKKVRDMISEGGMKKKPGSSVIEINGEVEEFIVGGLYHPQVHEMLKMLHSFCKMENLDVLSMS